MDPQLTAFLARLSEADYADLAGADLRLRLPIRERVLNDLLAATVVASNPKIERLEVQIVEDNLLRITVVSPAIPFASRVSVDVTIDREMTVSPSLTLTVFLVREGLARWLAVALPFVSSFLPPTVTRHDHAFVIDVGRILQEHGWGAVTPFIRSASLETERGVLWLSLHLAR
jgi:hypothetical protein